MTEQTYTGGVNGQKEALNDIDKFSASMSGLMGQLQGLLPILQVIGAEKDTIVETTKEIQPILDIVVDTIIDLIGPNLKKVAKTSALGMCEIQADMYDYYVQDRNMDEDQAMKLVMCNISNLRNLKVSTK